MGNFSGKEDRSALFPLKLGHLMIDHLLFITIIGTFISTVRSGPTLTN